MLRGIGLQYPLRDPQKTPAHGYCRGCGAELYSYDPWPLCLDCEEERNGEYE